MRLTSALVVLALLVPLAACAPVTTTPDEPAPTRAIEAPVVGFETEDEALAAAEEAIRKYLAVSDEVDSPKDLDRLRPLSTDEWFEFESESREELWSKGIHTEGTTVVRSVELQYFDRTEIAVYVCQETSGTRLVDAAGRDVTGTSRSPEALLQITLVAAGKSLLVAGGELWSHSCS